MRPPEITDALIASYEGLIRSTAWRYVEHCEEDYDDICQLFRVKAWKALLSFDPSKVTDSQDANGRSPRDRYVYACIKNMGKDLVKRSKRNWAFIEDMRTPSVAATDGFDQRYLLAGEEEVHRVLCEMPMLPSTLSPDEHQIVTMLYLDFDNGEVAALLNWRRKDVAAAVRRIREKMADWKPTAGEEPSALPPDLSSPAASVPAGQSQAPIAA